MPTLEQHKKKYIQNKELLDNELNIMQCQKYDWIVTVAFYAAVHLVEGELSKVSVHNTTHTDRGVVINRFAMFSHIRSYYKTLYDRSIAARYSGSTASKEKAQQALQCLKKIEEQISL